MMAPVAAWETLDDDTLRLIVSKRRTAHFRALLINVCKPWQAAILQNTFADLEPFLHNLDRRKLVDVLRLAWTQPASIRTALSAAVGNVWTDARPPALADKRTWLAAQILKNDWVETRRNVNTPCITRPASWVPHRLRFTRGEVSITHALDNWECPRIDNEDWTNNQHCLQVDGDKVQELNMCESGCASDSISLTLNENLAGELQLVLATISTCLCWWYENIGYGNPPEDFEERTTYVLVDDDDGEDSEEEGEGEDEGEDEDEGSEEDDDTDGDEDENEDENEGEGEGEGEGELVT